MLSCWEKKKDKLKLRLIQQKAETISVYSVFFDAVFLQLEYTISTSKTQ